MSSIQFGIVSDEISQDFGEAVEYGLQWGIRIFELRCLRSGRVPAVDPAELRKVVELVERHRVEITAVSPGIFKHPFSNKAALEKELSEVLPKTVEMAQRLGAGLIIVFGFERSKEDQPELYGEAVNLLRRAAAVAEEAGMRLAIENEPGFWCDTGKNTARMIGDVGSKALGANWDPCNGYGTDERPYPDGYEAIKEVITNVHVKDTQEGALIKCVPVGEGAIDWKGQLRAIVHDRIVRHVTIETHCLPLIEKSKQNVDTLRSYLEEIRMNQKAIL